MRPVIHKALLLTVVCGTMLAVAQEANPAFSANTTANTKDEFQQLWAHHFHLNASRVNITSFMPFVNNTGGHATFFISGEGNGCPVSMPMPMMPSGQGSMPMPSGSMPSGQGSMPMPSGSMPMPSGQGSMPMPSMPMPSGQGSMPMPSMPMPSGQGSMPMPSGSMPMPSGQGSMPMPSGSMPHPNFPHPNGSMPHPNGSLPHPNGSMPHPNGSLPHPNGSMPHPNGSMPHPNGSLPLHCASVLPNDLSGMSVVDIDALLHQHHNIVFNMVGVFALSHGNWSWSMSPRAAVDATAASVKAKATFEVASGTSQDDLMAEINRVFGSTVATSAVCGTTVHTTASGKSAINCVVEFVSADAATQASTSANANAYTSVYSAAMVEEESEDESSSMSNDGAPVALIAGVVVGVFVVLCVSAVVGLIVYRRRVNRAIADNDVSAPKYVETQDMGDVQCGGMYAPSEMVSTNV